MFCNTVLCTASSEDYTGIHWNTESTLHSKQHGSKKATPKYGEVFGQMMMMNIKDWFQEEEDCLAGLIQDEDDSLLCFFFLSLAEQMLIMLLQEKSWRSS